MARDESLALRAYSFIIYNPLRTDAQEQWAQGFRAALRVCGMDPGWTFVDREES